MVDSNYTQQDPEDAADDWLAREFQIGQALANVRTIVQVQVIAVQGGGVAAPPTVSVQPLVKIIDGQGNATSHGTINNIPVSRVGCGNGSIIADPVKGDVGWMAICDRDSSVVATTSGKESQPGSRRMHDLADGIYIGILFGKAPTQYIQFTDTGINQGDVNGNTIKSDSTGISINGLKVNKQGQIVGNLPVTGALELGGSVEDINGGLYSGNIHTTGTITGDTDVIAAGKSGKNHLHETLGGSGTNTSAPL